MFLKTRQPANLLKRDFNKAFSSECCHFLRTPILKNICKRLHTVKKNRPRYFCYTPVIVEGVGPSKNWVTFEIWNFLLERGGINLKRMVVVVAVVVVGGWVDVEIGGCHFFLLFYSSITFTLYVGKVKFPLLLFFLRSFELAMQDFHPSLYSTKALYHLYISDPFW